MLTYPWRKARGWSQVSCSLTLYLTEDSVSIPSTQCGSSQLPATPTPRVQTFFWPLWLWHAHGTQKYMQAKHPLGEGCLPQKRKRRKESSPLLELIYWLVLKTVFIWDLRFLWGLERWHGCSGALADLEEDQVCSSVGMKCSTAPLTSVSKGSSALFLCSTWMQMVHIIHAHRIFNENLWNLDLNFSNLILSIFLD